MKKLNSAFIEKPTAGRRLVISDIHGCSRTFKKLLKKIEITKNDQLFILGDAVNKGPNSRKVLNQILKLQQEDYQVFFIRGNHEQIILNCKKKTLGQRKRTLKSVNALELLEGKKIKPEFVALLKNSYHYIETNAHFLVHAGFNHEENTFSDMKAMLQTRNFQDSEKLCMGKQVIIGHTPSSIKKIKKDIEEQKSIICIDNGCVNINEVGQGRLLCLNLDTMKTHTQKYAER
ncbi:metallophosphoesterase [Vicingaceae bacterium]|nr:metallophosphoesterase [Vicingaceae bacterium]